MRIGNATKTYYWIQRPIIVLRKPKWMTHTIDSSAINKYAIFFPGGCIYIALVPNKEICDKFRLASAKFAVSVPCRMH